MKFVLLLAPALVSLSLEAATIKTIKGNKASLKLSPQELELVESDASYDIVSNGSNIGRIKVVRIFPGRGIQGTLESKTNGLKTASSVTLAKVETAAPPNSDAAGTSDEETGIKPSYGRPEPVAAPVGVHFNLLLGTHEITRKDVDSSIYASNFSFRTLYKFSSIPLGIGGHLKNNSITRTDKNEDFETELRFDFSSLGASLMLVQDFGSFRPYALYELSSGNLTLTAKSKSAEFGTDEAKSDGIPYLGNTLMLGGSFLLGKFSIGLEYQAFGQISYKPTGRIMDSESESESESESTIKLNSTGFSVNLGYSI